MGQTAVLAATTVLLVLLAGSTLAADGGSTTGSGATAFSWRSAMGVHYALSEGTQWTGATRGWPGHYSIGYVPDVTDHPHDGIAPTKGHFSGEDRYYNFGPQNRKDTIRIRVVKPAQIAEDAADSAYDASAYETKTVAMKAPDYDEAIRQAMAEKIDLVQLVMGNVKPGRPEFEILMPKNGAYFKDVIYATVLHAHQGEFARKPMRIYYQVGNEVNAYSRFHITPDKEAEKLPETLKKLHPNNDPVRAADYVEYYLAPAVEAIRAASEKAYGDPRAIKILCGSVSGIRKKKAREFLDSVLNTVVRGDRAPTLRGQRAWELVDAISIHYSSGRRDILDPLFKKWIRSGKVKGLWITEELGARGAGFYSVMLTSFRFLDFWSRHPDHWSPDATRLFFWGTGRKHPRSAGKGKEALDLMGDYLRDYPLLQAEDEVMMVTNADAEWYALRADESKTTARYAICMASFPDVRAKLRQVILKGPEGKGMKIATAKAWVLDAATGIEPLPVEVVQDGAFGVVNINYELPVTAAVFLQITAERR